MPKLVKRDFANGHGAALDRAHPAHPPTNPVLAEALRLHAAGWWVVPCRGKSPDKIKAWGETRLTADDLRERLAGGRLNIGIVLSRSHCIDIECDSAEAERALLKMFGGRPQRTPTWSSSRGKHRLFRRPAGCADTAKFVIDGVEVRGLSLTKAAQSVVPPSVGRAWVKGLSIHEVEPAELPPNVVERLRSGRPGKDSAAGHKRDDGKVEEGDRNNTLFRLACKLVEAGATYEEVLAALLARNKAVCEPPLSDDEVADVAKSACSRAGKPHTVGEKLLAIVGEAELWHTPGGVGFVSVTNDGHREHWPIRSRSCREWLAWRYWQEEESAPGSQTLGDALTAIEGRARHEGAEHPVYMRVASHGGRVYVDLGGPEWRAVEIDATDWRIVTDPPVRFRRSRGMLPLPTPVGGGSVEDLRRFANVTDEQWPLLVGWLVGALRPDGPYSILKFLGEQGSAKTTTGEVCRKLIDPSTALLRRPPKSDRDLMIAASNGWVCGFDNLSYVNPELSDCLCSLATGGGFATRTLYTDEDETILSAARPIILNGIEDPALRSDLLDRCVILDLPRIGPGKRRDAESFWRDFDAARPEIFGALLTAVSTALRNLPAVKAHKTDWPRMADFAQWVVAAEPALGLTPDTFLRAYAANRARANETALETSPVAAALVAVLEADGEFTGTATDLLTRLGYGQDTRARSWPKNARALSGVLQRLGPNLRAAGVVIEQGRKGNDRVWRATYADRTPPALRLRTGDTPKSPVSVVLRTQSAQKTAPIPKPKPTFAGTYGAMGQQIAARAAKKPIRRPG